MYLHDFDVVFCVKSNTAEWGGLAPADVLSALRRRVAEITEGDVFEAVGFVNTFLSTARTDAPEAAGEAGQLASHFHPRHPEGTRIVSLFGESGDTDEGIDVQTGPNAMGTVSQIFPEQENCYLVEFPGGICVFLGDGDLADRHYYQVLDAGTGVAAMPNLGDAARTAESGGVQ